MVESSSSLPPPAQTTVRGGGDDTHLANNANTNANVHIQEVAQHAGGEARPAVATKKVHAHPQGIVVKTFLEMYYNVLTKKSEHLFGFYKPHGSFQHSMAANAEVASKLVLANGVTEIQQKCAQLPYSHTTVHMVSVSHQALANESMLILVTGVMDGLPFVQSFVLAKEAEGVYYLENDILHISTKEPITNLREGPEYIGHEQVTPATAAAVALSAPEPVKPEETNGVSGAKEGTKVEKASETVSAMPAPSPGPVLDAAHTAPSATALGGTKNASKDHPKPEKKKDVSAVTEATAVTAAAAVAVPAAEAAIPATAAPAEKTSWASLFRKDPPAHPVAAPVASSAPAPVSGDSKDVSGAASDESTSVDGGENTEGGTNVVWVGQLPSDAGLTPAKVISALQEFFTKYGTVTRTNVYLNKGFAFVDMDSVESAQNALNAWPKDRNVLETSLQVKNLVVKTKKAGTAGGAKKEGSGSGSGSGRRQRDRIKVEESVKRVNGEDVPVKSFRTAGGYGKSSNKKAQAS